MTDTIFDVVIRHRSGSARTAFSHAELYLAATEAYKLADRLSDESVELEQEDPVIEVAIEQEGNLELSIRITPGHPLFKK